jgi:hypothetical protein
MRAKVTKHPSQQVLTRLTRILEAFAKELIEASDEEILEAAKDLGMNPDMKGSAAFLGVIHATPRRLSDIFDLVELKKLLPVSDRNRIVSERLGKAKSSSRRSGRRRLSSERKPSNGK